MIIDSIRRAAICLTAAICVSAGAAAPAMAQENPPAAAAPAPAVSNAALFRGFGTAGGELLETLDAENQDKPDLSARVARQLYLARKETMEKLEPLLKEIYDPAFDIMATPAEWTNQRALARAQARAAQVHAAAPSMPASANEALDEEKAEIADAAVKAGMDKAGADYEALVGATAANQEAMKKELFELFKVRSIYLEAVRKTAEILVSRRESYYIDHAGEVHFWPGTEVAPHFAQLTELARKAGETENGVLRRLTALDKEYAAIGLGLLATRLKEPDPPPPSAGTDEKGEAAPSPGKSADGKKPGKADKKGEE